MPTQAASEDLTDSEIIDSKITKTAISTEETDGLLFMREEEKLARDVYLVLYEKWNRIVFANIASSEQKHTDAIKVLLDQYEITDPVDVDSIGIFKNEILQALFVSLIEQGNISLVEALKVGALIEEIDILDIQNELDAYVQNEDIRIVYENLIKGSKNHLRAFVRNLSRQGIDYVPQKLDNVLYQSIINGNQGRSKK